MLIHKVSFKRLNFDFLKCSVLFKNKRNLSCYDFADRHIGPSELEKQQMLDYLGFKVCYKIH